MYLIGAFFLSVVVPLVASDGSAGSSEETNIGAYFVHKTVIIPHDDKKYRGGEDAAATSSHLLVVADGVGGWASSNVNPTINDKVSLRRHHLLNYQWVYLMVLLKVWNQDMQVVKIHHMPKLNNVMKKNV